MPACEMNDERQIAAESRQIFKFCSLKLWRYCTDLHQRHWCSYKSMHLQNDVAFSWKCQSKELRRSILTSAKRLQS